MSILSWVARPLQAALVSFLVTLAVCDNLISLSSVSGESMCPTLNPEGRRFSDLVLVRKARIRPLKQGDLVTLKSPHDHKEILVKRVKGVEGDYLKTRSYKNRFVLVPRGHIWVEGDNSERSVDSNMYGPVSQNLVTGKLICVLWPRFSSFN